MNLLLIICNITSGFARTHFRIVLGFLENGLKTKVLASDSLPNDFRIRRKLRRELFGGETEKIIEEINKELAA
jgi:hypothetical protein